MAKGPGKREGKLYPRRRQVRLLVLLPVAVALVCFVASRLYVARVGGTFDYRADGRSGEEFSSADVRIEPEGVVDVQSVGHDENGDPTVRFEAHGEGSGDATISFPDGSDKVSLHVSDGVIVANEVDFSGWESIELSLIIVALSAGLACTIAVALMLRDAWFGYEMAAYVGAGLFFFLQAACFVQIALADTTRSLSDLMMAVLTSAGRFDEIMLLPLTVVAVLVALSNVALVRREGMGLANILGVLLAVAFVAARFAWRWLSSAADTQMDFGAWAAWQFVKTSASVTLSFALALLIGVSLVAWLAARHVPRTPRDYLIVLGCGLNSDGLPTPLLEGRIEAARSQAQRQAAAGAPLPTLVLSGGQGSDEPWSEAEAMARYLQREGDSCPQLLERASGSTRENMAFSRELIESDAAERGTGVSPNVGFSTTNYHVLRGYVYAHEVGLAAEGIAAKTRAYFWPNAFLREFVGLVVARLGNILLALFLVNLVYAAATYVVLIVGK